jgi:hypothetical protein
MSLVLGRRVGEAILCETPQEVLTQAADAIRVIVRDMK